MNQKLQKLAGLPASEPLRSSNGGVGGAGCGSPQCESTLSADEPSVRVACPLCSAPLALDRQAGRQEVVCSQCGLYCELTPPPPAAPPEIQLPMVETDPEPTDEFQRWLAGKPIKLRPPGRLDRLRQWRREQPALAALAAAMILLLAATTLAAVGANAWTLVQLNGQKQAVAASVQQAQQMRLEMERQILSAKSSAHAAEARLAQAKRESLLTYASHLAWRSQQLDEVDLPQAVSLAAESLTIALEASAHPPALAHQNLRQILSDDDGRLLRGHTDAITVLEASLDGRWLASASDDATVRLWPLSDQAPSRSGVLLSGHLGSVGALAFTSDQRWLASAGDDSTVRFWDLSAPDPSNLPWTLRAKASHISAVAISADNRWVAVAARGASADESTVRVWDLASDDPANVSIEATSRDGTIESLSISPDSRWLLTVGAQGAIRLWKLSGQRPLTSSMALSTNQAVIRKAMFTRGGWLAAAGSVDAAGNAAYVWGLNGEEPSAPIVLGGYGGDVQTIDVSRDGRWLATCGDDARVRVWDLQAQNPAACGVSLAGHSGPVGVVKISPDSRWIISGGQDRTIRLWSLTGQGPDATPVVLRKHSKPVSSLAISADGSWFASAADDELRLWTLKLERLIALAQQRTKETPLRPTPPAEMHVAIAKPPLPAAIAALPPLPANEDPPFSVESAAAEQEATSSMIDFSSFLR